VPHDGEVDELVVEAVGTGEVGAQSAKLV